MVGAAIAAIQGVKRGTELGKKAAETKRRQESANAALLRQIQEQEKKMVDQIMLTYDKDGTGTLDESELRPMLRDYSKQAFSADVQPSEDDIAFLFVLYDRRGVDVFDKQELLRVCDAWCEFMKQKDVVMKLLEEFDSDRNQSIELQELQDILNELKTGRNVETVPETVTHWIFKQADVNGNDSLSLIELARALCAFELWTGKRIEVADLPTAMAQDIRGVESQPRPEPRQSTCCNIS
eukprot:CAMPEP_0169062624 /NCGR_PEP_ID=MMETSP1015-20121227/798_1 /TAXON_ID=342587 /ORGANISM="Karlodinium micrum, Strain CCMP2283" /LENGTH=237 /DNA_ID=CAMNT_0009120801 /DNA_START=8 /DNA_END=721 /DNA_ORIENTATION=-